MSDWKENEIIAFEMTGQEVIDTINEIYVEHDKNKEDTRNYTEYAKTMSIGRSLLKTQEKYYSHMPKQS